MQMVGISHTSHDVITSHRQHNKSVKNVVTIFLLLVKLRSKFQVQVVFLAEQEVCDPDFLNKNQ